VELAPPEAPLVESPEEPVLEEPERETANPTQPTRPQGSPEEAPED